MAAVELRVLAPDGDTASIDLPAPAPVTATMPSAEVLAEEIDANPHVTPLSLVIFFMEADDSLQTALESEAVAEAWMEEVGQLMVENEALHEVVQATYLEQAQRLARRFPVLEAASDRLWRGASARVRALTS